MSALRFNLSRFGMVVGLLWLALGAAQALPALQIGSDGSGDWTYDNSTQTWVWTGMGTATLNAFANDTAANGGNGDYAWDAAGAGTQTAYLVLAAVPKSNLDGFDVTVNNDGGSLTLIDSGFGSPPLNDPNSLSPHGIFDTYFEIYEFAFDGLSGLIGNTQPGDAGTGAGFVEEIDIVINSLLAGATGIHVDLFTVIGDGILDISADPNNKLVKAFAPYSHDGELTPVPLPAALPLLAGALGLMGLLGWRRRRTVTA